MLIAAQAAAVRLDDGWDVGTGGGALVGWRRPGRLALVGFGLSGLAVSQRGGGRLAAEIALALDPGAGLVGLSLGPTLELEPGRAARPGGQATLSWGAGAMPYARFSAISGTGLVVDLGLAVVLPTLRW